MGQSSTLQMEFPGATIRRTHAEFAERRKQRLKAGFFGDLALISVDVGSGPAEALADPEVAVTIYGGCASCGRE